MNGSLAQRCPADILSEVQRRRVSGVLTVERGSVRRQLFIEAGARLRFAASNHPSESLTGLFLARGGLEEAAFRSAMESRQPDELLGTALVRLGLIPAAAAAAIVHDHVRQIARATLSMSEGSWQFEEGALSFHDQLVGSIHAGEILLEWARGFADAEWIRRRLGPADARIQRERRPPDGFQDIRLNATEGYLMSRVDGAATIREICMLSPMGEAQTLAALLGLALSGLLEMPAGAFDLPAPRTPAPDPGPASATTTGRLRVVPFPVRPGMVPAPVTPGARPVTPAPSAGSPVGINTLPGVSRPVLVPPTGHAAPLTTPPAGAAASSPAPAPAAGPTTPAAKPTRTATVTPAAARPTTARPAAVPANGPPPAPGRPTMARRAAPGKRVPAAPRKAAVATPPAPRATSAELEAEMLRRFEALHSQDLYQVLEVPSTSGTDEVRRAYYALARRFHPDKFQKEEIKAKAEKVFARITEAYSTLTNEDLRQRYEEERARADGNPDSGAADTTDLARQNFRHGKEHLERGRLAEALSSFQNACDQDRTKPEYFEALGMTQARNPRMRREAEENLLKAIELAPTRVNAYVQLGALYERAAAPEKAREMYRRALQWDPENAAAKKALEADAPAKRGGLFGLFGKR